MASTYSDPNLVRDRNRSSMTSHMFDIYFRSMIEVEENDVEIRVSVDGSAEATTVICTFCDTYIKERVAIAGVDV